MPRQCSPGWQTTSIAITSGSPARRDRPIAIPQLTTTLSQQLATSHPGLQIRPQLNPRQWGTLDPERPEDLKGCAPSAAQAHFHSGGFLQNPKLANQESPVSIAGHEQNA